MASYKVDTVIETLPNAYMGLDKTFFTTGGMTVYMFHQLGNEPKPGAILEGTINEDRRRDLKFTKPKLPQYAPTTPQQTQAPLPSVKVAVEPPKPLPAPVTVERTFKADPDKMKQQMTLETATNMSIQRQVAVKATVELIVSGKRDYLQLHETYVHIMEMLSEPDWKKFSVPDGPPIDNYDFLPTDEDIANLDEGLDGIGQDGFIH